RVELARTVHVSPRHEQRAGIPSSRSPAIAPQALRPSDAPHPQGGLSDFENEFGNPGGSPEATRRAFNKRFLLDLAEAWQQHGREVFKRVRRESPAAYLKVCALLVPKEMKVETVGRINQLTDEQLDEAIEATWLHQRGIARYVGLGLESRLGEKEVVARTRACFCMSRARWPMSGEKLPAWGQAPPQSSRSSLGCRDQSHPHWSSECNPKKSHVRYTPAGSCHGCGTACPYRQRKGIALAHPLDCAHRLRHSSEAGRAAASRPRSASILAILPCGRPWPRRTRPDHPRRQSRHSGSPCLREARSKGSVRRYRPR